MKALDRKLWRDLRLMWSQALTIALVVASGVGGFVTSLSAVDSLALARDRFYVDGRFADLFAAVKRAPNSLAETLMAAPGVADVQTGVEEMVRIEIPGLADPIIGHLIGLDPRVAPRLNRIAIAGGRALDADSGTRSSSPARRSRPSSSSPACGACPTRAATASSGSTATRSRPRTT